MALHKKRKSAGRKGVKIRPADVAKTAKTTADVAEVVGTVAAFIPGVGGAVNLAAKAVEKGADAVAEKAGKMAKHKKRRAKHKERKAAAKETVKPGFVHHDWNAEVAKGRKPARQPMSTGVKVGLGLAVVAVGAMALRRRRA